jgi:ribonuclease PH
MRKTPREIKLTTGINPYAAGSVLCEYGNTKVHVTASVEERVPPFMRGQNKGWVTAEYSMLPGSTHTRSNREKKGASGRSSEIQRLIGRSLRAAINMKKLGERTITIDCDVLVADGGTRTASITGGWLALKLAIDKLRQDRLLSDYPIINQIAAVSVGVDRSGNVLADLNYEEDSSCNTDMNIVMTADNKFIEVQGTAEGEPYSKDELNNLIECAQSSLEVIFEKQNEALK